MSEGTAMTAVVATAVATWLIMFVLDTIPFGGFLIESTIAVLGGAALGLATAWYLRRRGNAST
jgi:hypothetical protein